MAATDEEEEEEEEDRAPCWKVADKPDTYFLIKINFSLSFLKMRFKVCVGLKTKGRIGRYLSQEKKVRTG